MPRKAAAAATKLTPSAMMVRPDLLAPYFQGTSWDRWRAVLKAAFAEPLTKREATLFREVAGDRSPPPAPVRELWAIVGRRGGKDSVASAVAAAAALGEYPQLRPGERAAVVCIAPTRDQAALAFRYILGYFDRVPLLKAMITKSTDDTIELSNNTEIVVATNNFRGIRGRSVVVAILDECAFYRSDDSANPDTELYAALVPAMQTFPNALLVGISTPYRRKGLLYNKWRRSFGQDDPKILVVHGASRIFNDTLDQAFIDEQLAEDEEFASAEYLAQWRNDLSDFLDRELVESAIDAGVIARPRQARFTYAMFVDASGGRGDSFTYAVAHADGDAVLIDAVVERRSPFDPSVVVAEVGLLAAEYGITRVVGDNYAAAWVTEGFARRGLFYEKSERSRSEIYRDVLPLFTSGRIRLVDHHRMVQQLVSLERRTSRSGKDSVNHPAGGRDDVANAAAGAAVLVASDARPGLIQRDDLLTGGVAVSEHVAPDAITGTIWSNMYGETGWVITSYSALEAPHLMIIDFGRGASPLDDIYKAVVPGMRAALDSACANGRPTLAPNLYLEVPDQLVDRAVDAMRSFFSAEVALMEQHMMQHGLARQVLDVIPVSQKLMNDPEAMLLRASVHIGAGDVKLGPVALAKSRELPIFGALAVKPGEAVTGDVLRVACLLAVSQLSPAPADPVGASIRWG